MVRSAIIRGCHSTRAVMVRMESPIQISERVMEFVGEMVRANAANLVELKLDVIVPVGARVIPILMQLTRTIRIILPGAVDAKDHD